MGVISINLLKPFILQVKGNHSIGKEFQKLAVQRKTVEIDIFVTSRNSDTINQYQVDLPPEQGEVEPVEPVQMKIYQSNIYRKDLR